MPKIKVLTYNKAGYDKAVRHAIKLGAVSRDGDTAFNSSKTSLVIDGKFMMCSKAGYTPKKVPYDSIIDLDTFKTMTSLTSSAGTTQRVPAGTSPAEVNQKVAVAATQGYTNGFADGEAVGYEDGYCDGTVDAAPQKTLKCTKATILVQNPVVWATMGIPFFRDNGIEIVEHDDKMYTLDLVTNTSVEFTAKSAAEQAQADLIAGNETVYTSFVKNFDLADELVYTKVLVDESQED